MTKGVYMAIQQKSKEFAKFLKDAAVSVASTEYEADLIMVQAMVSSLKAVGEELDDVDYGGTLCDAAYYIDKKMGWLL